MAKRLPYAYKLAKLREIVDRFDSKKFDTAPSRKTRTAAGKKARAAELKKVSAAYARIRPFIHRVHTVVAPKKSAKQAAQLEELRKYAGLYKLKGLRAVPLPSTKSGKVRVTFDKKNRPTVKEGHAGHKLFRFRRMPRDADDAIELLEELVPTLPKDGIFVLATRHHFLIGGGGSILASRDQLVSQFRRFVYEYVTGPRGSPEFARLIFGVKWLSGSGVRARKIANAMLTERGRMKLARERAKSARAMKQIIAMDRSFRDMSIPRTQRPELTREQKANLKNLSDKLHGRKKPKLSERARKTGRR